MMIVFSRFLSPVLILSVFLLDRWSKVMVRKSLTLGESVPVLPFLGIHYVQNTGMAFGMGQNLNSLFVVVSAILLVFLFFLLREWENSGKEWKLKAGLALVLGGAMGNLFDRILYGSVIDFMDIFAGPYHWPTFNLADSSICAGAVILTFSHWKSDAPS
ncbi:MAG: signal peptidase II [Elusimicrobia bacterium]|nr:signal peptidase II [Elusimicrobiota bacterium]